MRMVARALALVATAALVASPARAQAELTSFRCSGKGGAPEAIRTIPAMENSYIAATGYGDCWFHTGHHTYDAGAPHAVGHVTGSVFTVEANLSPPTDVEPPTPSNRTVADLFFEASTDGRTWSVLRKVPYNFRIDRQAVAFDFHASGAVARYFRIRQPRSAAQGLSGFLDASGFDAELTPVASPPPEQRSTARLLACDRDLMERFFDARPCWFGGINRYDSPSVFHTYALGPSSLDRVTGSATFLPWRTDDYFFNSGSVTGLAAHVQVSANGVDWQDAGTVEGPYGAPIPFELSGLGGLAAGFVRLVAEYLPNPDNEPPLKHVRGFLVDSRIEIEGTLAV